MSESRKRRILKYCIEHPGEGNGKIATNLNEQRGLSPSTVYNLLKELDLETAQKRYSMVARLSFQKGRPEKIPFLSNASVEGYLKNDDVEDHSQFPGQVGFFGILKIEMANGDLFQHILIDHYTRVVFGSLLSENNFQTSKQFLLSAIDSKSTGITFAQIRLPEKKKFGEPSEYQNLVYFVSEDLVYCHDGMQRSKKCEVLYRFEDFCRKEFYSPRQDVRAEEIKKGFSEWLKYYNRTPNFSSCCYGLSPNDALKCSKHLVRSQRV